ncbi:MAG: LptA/OstA family protein, partial [Candidatus Omnitrophota bacterium]|nr:LptA/OstA family protein [Candidatus Omnitrophota bacterium]
MIRKIFLVFIVLMNAAFPLYGEEEKKAEVKGDVLPIVVNGDRVEYDHAHKTVSGNGNVSIVYKDMKLTCDRIIIDIDKKEGIAEGSVTLYQEGDIFRSDKVVYNFEKKRGELFEGTMEMVPWYGKAELIKKTEDTVYRLNKSYVTTCDLEIPHYRIEARTIKVYLNNRVTAWHAFLYIGDVPVMYFPYYNHPLEDNLPQANVIPGRNGEWGTYLLTAWRYFFHPDSKGHVHLDYRSKRGFAKGADYKYKLGKFGGGYATFYHLHDKEPDESQELGTELPSERWRAAVRHKWEVDKNTFVAGEYHRLSDQAFIKDFFYKEEYELEEQPDTYLTLIGAKENYNVTVLYRKKVNDFFTVTERLPEVQMNISPLRLFNHLNLYYSSNSSFVRLNKKHEKDVGRAVTPTDNYDVTRLDSYNKLSYPTQVMGFLNINPFVGARET